MAGLKVVVWNSGGICASAISTPGKTGFFDKEFPEAGFSVAAFVETHHKTEADFPDLIREYAFSNHLLHTPTPPGYTHGGIIVLVNKQYDILQSTIVDPGRFLNVRIAHTVTKREYNLSVYYGYRLASLTKAKMSPIVAFFRRVIQVQDNNIVIGDFNFADCDIDKGKGMNTRDKMFTALWEEFKSEVNLQDPYRIQFPDKLLYSFVAPSGKSRAVRAYVNEESVQNVVNYKYLTVPFNLAHKIMSFTLNDQQPRGPSYWKMNSSILNDRLYTHLVQETVGNVNELCGDKDPRWWELFLTCIRSKTVQYTKQKHFIETGIKTRLRNDIRHLEAIPSDALTAAQSARYQFLKESLRVYEEKEVEGYRTRTKGLPKYEQNEPGIAFYAKLEKRKAQRTVIGELRDKNGVVFRDTDNLLHIVKEFYQDLYTPCPVDSRVQDTLLNNIDKKVSVSHKAMLDADLTVKELETAVYQQQDDKSPGIDGITAEFYKKFWPLLHTQYLTFINHARRGSFPANKNAAVTALLYKEKGEVNDLKNYRPISLINVDLKILTKALANRLKVVLPTVVHHTQTAVDGRRIDHTVHMIRDLIQLANNEDLESAFIFLDQEKAFDRVNHEFLFKTLKAFGIGDAFIHWIRVIYSNATTRIKVNGFLTDNVPLNRGVRQGCPLSSLLYVLVIEILALQFRRNPDIVGFTVGGEKIVSLHYADDAVITILQNRCFKEVIKDLADYEKASGAKVNYGKTQGLWVGKWKGRTDTPMQITWTSKNVKTLGVFFGNDDPGRATFAEIMPKIVRSMDYWKQFRLSKLAKARVVEIFHASRLWYAAKYYPLPQAMERDLQQAFFEYINYPDKAVTISQAEVQKLREHGGARLVNITAKSEASKIKWLMELCTNPQLAAHLGLVTRLFGVQKGNLHGLELFFTTKHYARKIMKIRTPFYNVAIKAMTTLDVKKQVLDPREEKLFHNPTFISGGKTLSINKTCEDGRVYTYGQLLDEVALRTAGQRHRKGVANIYDRMVADLTNRQDWSFVSVTGTTPFKMVTTKLLYAQILKQGYKDHHSSAKWVLRLRLPIVWDRVWAAVHNRLATEDVKSILWEQLHLNMYTTYSYNKWHDNNTLCPFCLQVPGDRFHIVLDCPITVSLWLKIEPFLLRIHPAPVTDEERAFGILGNTPPIILRNWLTYVLRACIHQQENTAYHNQRGLANELTIRHLYNARVKRETFQSLLRYTSNGRLDIFEKYFTVNSALVSKDAGDQWLFTTIFP